MDWFCDCEGADVPEGERGTDANGGPIHVRPGGSHTLRCETNSVILRSDFESAAIDRWARVAGDVEAEA